MVATPTVDQFLARFPQFEGSSEETIQALLNEAVNYVDDRWTEADQQPAILYLVAHMLQVEEEQIAGGAIASESFGPISVSYARNTETNVMKSTVYGQRFLQMAKRNFPGPIFVRASCS